MSIFTDEINQMKINGFTILRNCIPQQDIQNLKEQLFYKNNNTPQILGKILEKNSCSNLTLSMMNEDFGFTSIVLTSDKINNFLKELTGNKLKFAPHVDILLGKGNRSYHDDTQAYYSGSLYGRRRKRYKQRLGKCPHRSTDIVDGEEYQIYRVSIYLQKHTAKSGGMIVRPTSHLFEGERNINGVTGQYIEVDVGDVCIIDARLQHAADTRRSTSDRAVMIYACGRDNVFLDWHIKGALNKLNKAYGEFNYSDEYKKVLKENGYMY